MKKYLFYGSSLSITWIFVTGSPQISTLIQGMFFSYPLSFAFRNFFPGDFKISQLKKIPLTLKYTGLFVFDLVLSNLQVAHNILKPGYTFDSSMVAYSPEVTHPTAIAVLANSITLTPGTLVVDHLESSGELKIHCLDGECCEKTLEGIKKWDKLLCKVFG